MINNVHLSPHISREQLIGQSDLFLLIMLILKQYLQIESVYSKFAFILQVKLIIKN